MSEYRFDTDTDGRLIDDNTVEVRLDADWNVDGRILNGGYLQAVVVRAVLAIAANPGRVIAVSTSFIAPAQPGPATVEVTILRSGSSLTSASATLLQGASAVVTSLVTFASTELPYGYDDVPSRSGSYPTMPSVTRAEHSIRIPTHQLPGSPGLGQLIDHAFVPENSAWLSGDTSGGPHIRCWVDFLDGRPMDVLAAVAMVDIAPPVCFAMGEFGWAPTLQLQVGLFASPAPGP
ncbi:MAG: thioesterase family protein, partial [Nakamurella sp.]